MKKNRVKEDTCFHAADREPNKRTSENIAVFLVLAIIILGINVFPGLSRFGQKFVSVSPGKVTHRYIWLTGSSEMPEGLYLFTQENLENEYPRIARLLGETENKEAALPVAAVRLDGPTPRLIALPPDVANLFFQPIPINRADKNILASLPGIGPVLAERIVQRRRRQGPFKTKKELLEIAGIGQKKYVGLVDRITLD